MSDAGREAVYAAEIAAFEGTSHESIVPIAELVERAATVIGAEWWPRGDVPIVSARRDARSSTTRQRGHEPPVVRLAASQRTPATLVHELAHVLAGVAAGHGSVFRRAHVDLAGFVLGSDAEQWLVDAYAAMGLALGSRAWPVPPPRGGPIAL